MGEKQGKQDKDKPKNNKKRVRKEYGLSKMEKIFYICDGKKPGCRKTNCYKDGKITGTTCMHTADIIHALNFKHGNRTDSFFEMDATNKKIKLDFKNSEVMDAQRNTICINGQELPTWQFVWKQLRMQERRLFHLKIAVCAIGMVTGVITMIQTLLR